MSYELTTERNLVTELVSKVKDISVFKPNDLTFLAEKKDHLNIVMKNSWMWRTNGQKKSIIADQFYPTLHSKFHQAILEQKVQLDQTFYLAKDFETKKLDAELLDIEIEELSLKIIDEQNPYEIKKLSVEKKKKELALNFSQYELKNMEIAMGYRMGEVKGWQKLEEELLVAMKAEGMSDNDIWNKDAGELRDMFFQFINNLIGLKASTDAGEVNNLISLASFAITEAQKTNMFDSWYKQCNPTQKQILKDVFNIQ